MATTTTVTQHTVSDEESIPYRPRALGRVSQIIDYLFWLLYALLFIRLVLVFFHAASWTGFVRFIDTITNPFYVPFRGIVSSREIEGGFTLAVPILIALVAYAILHLAINKLLRVLAYRRTDV